MLYENKTHGRHMKSWSYSASLFLPVYQFLKARGNLVLGFMPMLVYFLILGCLEIPEGV